MNRFDWHVERDFVSICILLVSTEITVHVTFSICDIIRLLMFITVWLVGQSMTCFAYASKFVTLSLAKKYDESIEIFYFHFHTKE